MRLERVRVTNFRSIANASLERCGGFNVIIGKNNAGKSNLLLAVNSFFQILRVGGPVAIEPPIGETIDFHRTGRSQPIGIDLTFALDAPERQSLIEEMTIDAPQLRNAAEALVDAHFLTARVLIPPLKALYAYVQSLELTDDPYAFPASRHTILEIDDAAASELSERARHSKMLITDAEALRKLPEAIARFPQEYWERMRVEASSGTGRSVLRYAGPETEDLSPMAQRQLEDLIRASQTQVALREGAQTLATSLEKSAADATAEPLTNRIKTFAGENSTVPAYVRSLIRRIGDANVLYLTERRESIGKREAVQLLNLKVRRGGTEKLRNIQQTVSDLLGVEIDAFSSDAQIRRGESAELDVDKFVVQVNGAGIREALRLILDYEFRRPTILLVEEPEIHLHPALETSIMRYLKRIGEESQIFITTHSTNFLDTAEMRNVYLASRNGSTTIQSLTLTEAEEHVPRELGIRLSSLFMYDRLVFVEGPSDEGVIREWASILNVNLAAASVGFVPMGGVRNVAHFAAETTMSFLSRRRVSIWFIIDRDERNDDDVRRLTDSLGERAQFVVLSRREIENYLLSPRAIAALIATKLESSSAKVTPPSPEEVAHVLVETADGLRDVAVAYRVAKAICVPLYPNRIEVLEDKLGRRVSERAKTVIEDQRARLARLESDVDEIVADTERAISESWLTERLSIIPGHLLLDRLFGKYRLRFRKEQDSARLAAQMKADEIASEIRTQIESIGSLSMG